MFELPELRRQLAIEGQEKVNKDATAGEWGRVHDFLDAKEHGAALRKGQNPEWNDWR